MSLEVHQHPDGSMYVRTPGVTYVDTVVNFALDFGEVPPALPVGVSERVYTVGIRHALMGDGNVIDGGPLPWPTGDKWISNVRNGIAKQEVRYAQQVSKASQDHGSGGPQPQVRQTSGYTTVRGEGVQPSGQRDRNLTKEEKERLNRRI